MPKVGSRSRYEDPAEEIARRAKGWMAEKLLPTAEFLGKDRFREGKTWAEPFDVLEEAAARKDAEIPDYNPIKGIHGLVSKQITPGDIALTAAGPVGKGISKLAKMEEVGQALKFANPLRSEVGAVGKDIAETVPKISRKGGLLFDQDFANPAPKSRREIGNLPSVAEHKLGSVGKPEVHEIKTLPNEMWDKLESEWDAPAKLVEEKAAKAKELSEARVPQKPREKVEPRKAKEYTPAERAKQQADADMMFEEGQQKAMNERMKLDRIKEGQLTPGDVNDITDFELRSSKGAVEPGGKLPPQKPPNTPSGNLPPSGTPPNPTGGSVSPPTKKKLSLFKNLIGSAKTMTSGGDIQALRQNLVASVAHPFKVGIPSIKAGLRSEFGPKRMYDEVLEDIMSRPNLPFYEKNKIAIPEVGIQQEYPSDWPRQAEEAMGVAGPITRSERGYDATAKVGRANLTDLAIDKAKAKYGEDIPESTQSGIKNFVHDFTGYGTLGPLEPIADKLAVPFFSPRFRAATFHKLNPINYGPTFNMPEMLGGKQIGGRWGDIGKSMARQDASKFAGGTIGGLGAADYLAGDKFDVDWDPRSSDFASAKLGNTTFDMLGGARPMINAGARALTGSAKSSKEDQKVYPVDPGNVIGRYARSALGPGIPSMIGDAVFGRDKAGVAKDFIGQPIDRSYQSGPFENIPYLPWALKQISPMYPGDVKEAFEESGPVAGGIAATTGLLGAGSTSYDRTSNAKKKWLKKKVGVKK